ncbi:hypothetical protein [Sphingobacterium daejeonense]|uniref:hypothetical protein n=1 Tax=Sphingobacterium daejeonense TaxID=371142 RepID=UPI0010C5471A|nr:hypothetical protein [Sphingobacterium daejeonense]VTP93493.1 Uncharacterised protein [Sphingobacterium daejeonense]
MKTLILLLLGVVILTSCKRPEPLSSKVNVLSEDIYQYANNAEKQQLIQDLTFQFVEKHRTDKNFNPNFQMAAATIDINSENKTIKFKSQKMNLGNVSDDELIYAIIGMHGFDDQTNPIRNENQSKIKLRWNNENSLTMNLSGESDQDIKNKIDLLTEEGMIEESPANSSLKLIIEPALTLSANNFDKEELQEFDVLKDKTEKMLFASLDKK